MRLGCNVHRALKVTESFAAPILLIYACGNYYQCCWYDCIYNEHDFGDRNQREVDVY